jgi:REP element-mobilizing transposase RayT
VIFRSGRDRDDFLNRLQSSCEKDAAFVYAWCLMPNHIHLAIRTGTQPLSRIMQRLLTGYAIRFNKTHRRVGHLFENRYRSKVVDEEPYLLALVRYIHLNPVRAGIVPDLAGLESYPWSGHGALMGKVERSWQDTEAVLSRFGSRVGPARKRLEDFMRSDAGRADVQTFAGGGTSSGEENPWGPPRTESGSNEARDDRILGEGQFVESVLGQAEREARERSRSVEKRMREFEEILGTISAQYGLSISEITGGGRRRSVLQARSIACHLGVHRLGLSVAVLSRELHVSQSSVLRAVERGATMLDRSVMTENESR